VTDEFYREFEERHRGPRELIKSRLRVYLPFVEPLKAMYRHVPAVDLGCGRGEWLELMRDAGIDARGVDLNDAMLADCRLRDLAAEQGEALAHLRALPDESMAVVSGFHLAEHIPFADLQGLVREALRVLKPAGLLILETPNPENLRVGTSKFYFDPTHQRPLPPALLSFLPEYYGFARTKILRLHERSDWAERPAASLLDVLTDVSPDFAVVAQKACGASEHAASFSAAFERRFGIELETLAARFDESLAGQFDAIRQEVDRAATSAQARRETEQELTRLRQDIAGQGAAVERVNARLAALSTQSQELLAARDADIERLNARMEALLSSASWRLTRPLRTVAGKAGASVRAVQRRARGVRDWFEGLVIRIVEHPTVTSPLGRAGRWVLARPRIADPARSLLQRHPRLFARLVNVVLFPASTSGRSKSAEASEHWASEARAGDRQREKLTGSPNDVDELMLRIEDEVRRWRAERV
jgi:O-antigen chain-terminating methyltransferase